MPKLDQVTITKRISTKFIVLVSIVVLMIIAINAVIFLIVANRTQSKQAERFVQQLRTEQELEAQLLRDNLLQKGQSFALFTARNASKFLSNFDYEYLEKMGHDVERDPEYPFCRVQGSQRWLFL